MAEFSVKQQSTASFYCRLLSISWIYVLPVDPPQVGGELCQKQKGLKFPLISLSLAQLGHEMNLAV